MFENIFIQTKPLDEDFLDSISLVVDFENDNFRFKIECVNFNDNRQIYSYKFKKGIDLIDVFNIYFALLHKANKRDFGIYGNRNRILNGLHHFHEKIEIKNNSIKQTGFFNGKKFIKEKKIVDINILKIKAFKIEDFLIKRHNNYERKLKFIFSYEGFFNYNIIDVKYNFKQIKYLLLQFYEYSTGKNNGKNDI